MNIELVEVIVVSMVVGIIEGWLAGEIWTKGLDLVGNVFAGFVGALVGSILFPSIDWVFPTLLGTIVGATVGSIAAILLMNIVALGESEA